jgi:hypothetical protein
VEQVKTTANKILLSALVIITTVATQAQNASTPSRTRVREELPGLYSDWRLNILESTMNARERVMQQISFTKDEKALAQLDSIVSRRPFTFFDASFLPVERNWITHYGTARVIFRNHRMKTETTQDYYFIVFRFSTLAEFLMIPKVSDRQDKLDASLQGILNFDGKERLIIKGGVNSLTFEKNAMPSTPSPKSVNTKGTVWNENGLKGRISEVFSKVFEIRMSAAQIAGLSPIGLLHQKYSDTGLLTYHKEWDRGFGVERKIGGSFKNRVIEESLTGSQELTIKATLVVDKDSGKYDSFVDNKFLFGRKASYSNGRIVAEKRLNYLGNVEENVRYTYDANGNLYSYEKVHSNDMVELEVYKYLKFDATGNWTERIIYDSTWEPKRMEIRQISYY